MRSKNGLFIGLAVGLLTLAVGLFIMLAIVNGWNIWEWFYSPLAIVVYAILGCGACALGAYLVQRKVLRK